MASVKQAALNAILDHIAPRPGPRPNPMFDLLRHHPVLRHYAKSDGSIAMPAATAEDWLARGLFTEQHQLSSNFNDLLTVQDIIKAGMYADPPITLTIKESE